MDLHSSNCFTCILVIVDSFSKACKLIPLKVKKGYLGALLKMCKNAFILRKKVFKIDKTYVLITMQKSDDWKLLTRLYFS